jgi:hypothetical protein
MITLHTNFGDISVELDFENAPKSAANFQQYAEDGFYNGTIFHRVINDFMIQGGGFDADANSLSSMGIILIPTIKVSKIFQPLLKKLFLFFSPKKRMVSSTIKNKVIKASSQTTIRVTE